MATKTNTTINGRDYYRIRRNINGTQKSFYGKSKGDAERKYKKYLELIARVPSVTACEPLSQTFGEMATNYITNALKPSDKYAESTKYRYERSYLTHIKGSDLDSMPICDVRPLDIQKFYNGLDVSSQTIKGIHKFMSAFLKWLSLNSFSSINLDAVEMPKKPDNHRHDGIVIWDDDEIHAILQGMDASVSLSQRHRLSFFVYVLFYTGARISEALSLRYSDIEDDTVTIRRQCYMGEIKPPKYDSVRQIPMHDELKKALEEHRRWQKYDMKKNKYKNHGYIFTTSSGKLYDPSNIRVALKRFYNKIGIEHKHVHAYRATFCTSLCRCGVPLEVASSLMGHKSLEVTAAHYALIRKESKKEAIDKLSYDFPSKN